MRFHDERDRRLHPVRYLEVYAAPTGNQTLVLRRPATFAQRPVKRSQRPEVMLQRDWIADDALVISLCYEAHLSMQQMLAAFAEMRGDYTDEPSPSSSD